MDGSAAALFGSRNPYELLVKISPGKRSDTKTIGIEESVLKVSQLRRISSIRRARGPSTRPGWWAAAADRRR
jgi:hypothetical protein